MNRENENRSLREEIGDDTFKAYITNLGKYNEGDLVGKWVEFPIDEDDFNDILKSIGVSDEPDEDGNYYEEWFVTDYDSPVKLDLGEYPSYEQLNDIGEKIQNCGNLTALKNACEVVDFDEAAEGLEDGTIYFYPDINDDIDLGYYFIDNMLGGIEDLSMDEIERYFDYGALGRDLDFDTYESDEVDEDGEPILVNAGEYFCGDEDATNEQIGEAYVDMIGSVSEVSSPEYYFDYESFGRDLTYNGNFTFTTDGVIEQA